MIIEKIFVQHSTRATRPNSIALRDHIYDIHLAVNAGCMPIDYKPEELQQALERALDEYIQR